MLRCLLKEKSNCMVTGLFGSAFVKQAFADITMDYIFILFSL